MGWALPLIEGGGLERMPDASPAHTLETHERISLGASPDDRVHYEWRSTSRRGRADWVREHLAREGAVGLFKQYSADIQRVYPLAEPVRQDVESDDIAQNAITLVEVYDIPGAWTNTEKNTYQFGTLDLTMKTQLAPMEGGMPRHPIYLGQVGRVTRRVEIKSANDMRLKGWTRSVQSSALSFEATFKRAGPRTAILEQALEFRALTLPPEESDKYRAIVTELDKSDISITDVVNRRGSFVGAGAQGLAERGWFFWTWRLMLLAALVCYWIYLELTGQGPLLGP
jgi:hypothetical protein